MARTRGEASLRFRVRVPPGHPLHAALAALPPADRPTALLDFARQSAVAGDRADAAADIARELARIADALERIAATGAAVKATSVADAGADASASRLDALFRAFDEPAAADEGEECDGT